ARRQRRCHDRRHGVVQRARSGRRYGRLSCPRPALFCMSDGISHGPAGDNPYTRGIAEFVAGLGYERIPAEVIARIKLLILDALGCALYGTELPWSSILMTTLGRFDGTKACAVWGTDRRLSAPHAALVNGTLVQSFELDDVHRAGVLHVGAVTLPALIAVAEL